MRLLAERVARVLALALIAWAAWLALQPAPARGPHRLSLSRAGAQLPAWTREGIALHAAIDADTTGDPATRAWLAALRRAGARITWRPGSSLRAVALAVDPVAEPEGGVIATVIAPRGVALRERGILLDSLGAAPGAQGVRLAAASARIDAGAATSAPFDSLLLRPVLVVGRASWEARFVIAALEESGWTVERRLRVAPRLAIESPQGAAALDTTRFSAVVLLDSTAAPEAGALARFVAQGGGAVIAGSALGLAPVAPLLPARAGARTRPTLVATAGAPVTAATGGYRPLLLARDAVPLERQGNAVTVAARRAGNGKVIAIGYDESWRWRMEGDEQAPASHRRWWSRAVGSVAHASLIPRRASAATDPAPLAALHDALGAPSQEAPNERTLGRGAAPDPRVLLGAILLLLLAEWGSRRLRGHR